MKSVNNMANQKLCSAAEVKKKDCVTQSPLWVSDEVDYWPSRGGEMPHRFSMIAALHSELVAVNQFTGQIHQWRWADAEPYRIVEVDRVSCRFLTLINLWLTFRTAKTFSTPKLRVSPSMAKSLPKCRHALPGAQS